MCGFGHRLEVCERQNIKVSYVCYGVSLKVKGCGNVDGNGHKCFAKSNGKMAIILPTGQWYAPSAVINDAWYCMVLHGIS